ncbi:MAG TPA: hypothetical protein VFN26_12530 [Candidatus Acidoferrum sp.]|nr:hypothetical protein [Candidatus Acidoferrum sp.]
MRKKYVVQVLVATLGFAMVAALIALSVGAPDCSSHCLAKQTIAGAAQQSAPTPPAAPPDAGLLSLIHEVEGAMPQIADRGAALFFLARLYTRVGEVPKALAHLKECVALDQGFDPGAHRRLEPLKANPEFQELVEQVRRAYPPVHHARVAFTVPDKDLFPEGLAVDAEKRVFYMGSMHRKKIVKITPSGEISDFVPADRYDLMPVGGVHVDASDHSVWAATDPGEKNRSEIVHFDAKGKLLERYTAPGAGTHYLNDLVLRGTSEIYVTDTDANLVFRFDRKSHAFTVLKFPRPIFYPNGITLSGGGNLLYVADMLGVIAVDLGAGSAQDVVPDAHDTLSGIDGLYWYKGDLIGVQYGTAAYRVMRWHLAKDGHTVTGNEILERGTDLVKDPTTGAIFEGNFYFMTNTGIDNLEDDKIIDESKLEPVHIAVVALR